ncbi:MAG: PEGA domain-containing protein [Deltaproteobacteria bacterium]|nr:PEGA domain-containing protein [Deltaproteobacteria bacterium]
MRRHLVVASVLLTAALISGIAQGDDAQKARAREYFKHAVTLFDERRFADSLVEFEKSYALVPVFSTLYNIGQVHVALGHPVEAVDAFEKHLAQGGTAIPADQRARVEAELAAQRNRIGEIQMSVLPAGAELRIDGKVVGKAPLSTPVKVAAGHHRVEAMLEGYRSVDKEVDLQGKGRLEISFQLVSLQSPQELSPAPAPPAAPTARPAQVAPVAESGSPQDSKGSTQKIVGWSLAGVGLVGAGVGIIVAVTGQSKHQDALDQWYSGDHPGANDTESKANSLKTVGGVTIGAGAALLIGGTVLLLTAPSSSRSVSIAPWLSPSVAGAGLRAAW